MDTRMGEKVSFPTNDIFNSHLKAIQVFFKRRPNHTCFVFIIPAPLQRGKQIVQIMISQKQCNLFSMGLLQSNDVLKALESIRGNSSIAFRQNSLP